MGDEANGQGFTHPALFYRDLGEYLAGVGGFVHSGLKAGEPVFVAAPPDRLEPLRDHLGAAASEVELVDMAEAGRNPGRIMTWLTDFAARRGAGRAWLVGEPIWASRTAAEIREATRHEALINLAFAGVPVTILCPYDMGGLDPATLANAERTHPVLWGAGSERPSPVYTDPLVLNSECDVREDVPATAERIGFGPASLAHARQRAEDFAVAAGMSAGRAVDLKLAVGEAVANAVRHGGGAGSLAMWRDRDRVIIEISDRGRLTDPLAGRRRPTGDAIRGRGLWMIHHLCDLVELGQGRVRLHLAVT